jgi:5-methylcytosine-specific restriction endonuclease McrA
MEKIRWAKSAAGQRALMTARLRNRIKMRDNYTCRQCGVSLAAEPHLLFEVDHIMPVSKGGLSVPENLQTLCWRCNRTKAAKVIA